MNLDTKIALVTGANTGIGNALTANCWKLFCIGTSRNGELKILILKTYLL
jgi:NAD(P)-dependent dehydrogenase (short-subunit alcohol dehydrogenase family)